MAEPTAPDPNPGVVIRETDPGDLPRIVEMSREVYRPKAAWRMEELSSHLKLFPEGQLVATLGGDLVGMAASLILPLEDFPPDSDWWTLTGEGRFHTHDPERGETLYGAGILVRPGARGQGVGGALYEAREALVRRLDLERIVAGARLSGYREHADRMSAEEYVEEVIEGRLEDPALSFQLAHGFRVRRVVPNYLPEDHESLGYAAVVEWRP